MWAMCRGAWQVALSIKLRHLCRPDGVPRIAVVGMGQELRGDDGVGPRVARRLQDVLGVNDSVLVVDAGPAPENFTGALRRFGPDIVIVVDAAQMDEIPGRIHLLDQHDCVGLSVSTHTLPPSMLAEYLDHEVGCEVMLLGIQPSQTAIGSTFSAAVLTSIDRAASGIVEALVVRETPYVKAA
jgi:hydrogenase 3 maturation protease